MNKILTIDGCCGYNHSFGNSDPLCLKAFK